MLNDDGVIQEVAQGRSATLVQTAHQWIGRAWIDTVTGDTRNKVMQLLQEVTSTGWARRREINHPVGEGGNLAVAYTAIRLLAATWQPFLPFSNAFLARSRKWSAATGKRAKRSQDTGCCSKSRQMRFW